jgi:hypothetical protein
MVLWFETKTYFEIKVGEGDECYKSSTTSYGHTITFVEEQPVLRGRAYQGKTRNDKISPATSWATESHTTWERYANLP